MLLLTSGGAPELPGNGWRAPGHRLRVGLRWPPTGSPTCLWLWLARGVLSEPSIGASFSVLLESTEEGVNGWARKHVDLKGLLCCRAFQSPGILLPSGSCKAGAGGPVSGAGCGRHGFAQDATPCRVPTNTWGAWVYPGLSFHRGREMECRGKKDTGPTCWLQNKN